MSLVASTNQLAAPVNSWTLTIDPSIGSTKVKAAPTELDAILKRFRGNQDHLSQRLLKWGDKTNTFCQATQLDAKAAATTIISRCRKLLLSILIDDFHHRPLQTSVIDRDQWVWDESDIVVRIAPPLIPVPISPFDRQPMCIKPHVFAQAMLTWTRTSVGMAVVPPQPAALQLVRVEESVSRPVEMFSRLLDDIAQAEQVAVYDQTCRAVHLQEKERRHTLQCLTRQLAAETAAIQTATTQLLARLAAEKAAHDQKIQAALEPIRAIKQDTLDIALKTAAEQMQDLQIADAKHAKSSETMAQQEQRNQQLQAALGR